MSGGTYSLKSTPKDKIFEKLFIAILFTLRVFARNLLRESRWRSIFIFSFWCLNSGLTSNKPTDYLLDYGDLKKKLQLRYIYIHNIASVRNYCDYVLIKYQIILLSKFSLGNLIQQLHRYPVYFIFLIWENLGFPTFKLHGNSREKKSYFQNFFVNTILIK